ncbi:MAG TPA: hypothetical protein VGD79_11125 [Thermoanaerobaculia bacterium]|jgi:hypothetical protein
MNALLILILALAGDPATCPMHAQHMSVDQRGDHVMGFSHEKTKHTFRLDEDGGAVEVRANDAADAESVAAIRTHLQEIAKEFTAGDFAKPKEIHARVPDGVPVMKELGSRILYLYEELEGGARVRVKTEDPRGLEAVHQFLKFQIEDHHTGDAVEEQH